MKSQDQIWSAWFRKKVPHFWLEGEVAGDVLRSHLLDQGDGFGFDPGLRRLGPGLAPPDQAEQLAMPAEERIRLDDEKCLSQEGRRPGEEKQPESVPVAELGAFGMALQDDQLVTEEGVLGNELSLAAHGILNYADEERADAGFEHLLDAFTHVVDDIENVSSEAMESVEHAVIAPGIWR